jgi:hypothetical protein
VKKTATVLPGLVLALVVGALASAAVANANRDGHARGHAAKVTICHLTGSLKNPAVTITVDRSAVPAFMRQDDRLVACTAAPSRQTMQARLRTDETSKVGRSHDSRNGRSARNRTQVATTMAASATTVGASRPEPRMTICHLTGSRDNPMVTIVVDRSAVPAFMRQGDRLGACTIAPSTTTERQESTGNAQSGSASNQSSNGDNSGSSQSASAGNQSNSSNNNNGNDDGRQGDSTHH